MDELTSPIPGPLTDLSSVNFDDIECEKYYYVRYVRAADVPIRIDFLGQVIRKDEMVRFEVAYMRRYDTCRAACRWRDVEEGTTNVNNVYRFTRAVLESTDPDNQVRFYVPASEAATTDTESCGSTEPFEDAVVFEDAVADASPAAYAASN